MIDSYLVPGIYESYRCAALLIWSELGVIRVFFLLHYMVYFLRYDIVHLGVRVVGLLLLYLAKNYCCT